MRFVEIDRENYHRALEIELPDSQWRHVATPERSLADAYVWTDARPRLVDEDGEVVGFVMTFPFEERGERRLNLRAAAVPAVALGAGAGIEATLVRLIIERRYQRRGLGRAVVAHVLADAEHEGIATVTLSVQPDNAPAIALYRATGFVQKGMDGNELRFERRVAGRT